MTTVRQFSFAGGEISPSLYGRVDTVKYSTGLRTCRNFFVQRHGGVANRPGTAFVGEVKDSTKKVRLIPFIFNADQTYILEFGDLYMRPHRNGAQITETAQTITGATNADPCVITITGHGYSDGDEVYLIGVGGMTELNNRNFKVANKTANDFELQFLDGTDVDATAFGTFTTGGTAARVYTITTTYLEADLPTLHFIQSADIITIAHPTYPPREVARSGHTSWTITDVSFAPGIAAPTALSGTAGAANTWHVTAVASETFEESLADTFTGAAPPNTLTWSHGGGATQYNIYQELNGIAGYISSSGAASYAVTGTEALDITETPPESRNPFSGASDYPSTVAYIQQRLMFANTDNDPEKIWASRSGFFKNFTISTPLQNDDSLTFTLVGRQVNEVRSIVDLVTPVVLTASGEWALEGNAAGTLIPAEINPKQQGYNGSSELRPLIVGSTALFVQARGNIVRDLQFDFNRSGYAGNDLTIFSNHLVDGKTITDWDFQQIPHSIVWMVRDDGVLLGLTYVREHELFGWHRHDFDGTVENVAVVPEGNEDSLYLVINRTIDGKTVRYIEQMQTRQIVDVEDAIFMDSSLSTDGTNTDTSNTMTLSGGTTWSHTETLTLTSALVYFQSTDVGNQIHLTGSDGTIIRFTIDAFTSTTIVTGKANKEVPAVMRNTAITTWGLAVDELTGLWHLEGENVSVFADGFVKHSPNNAAYTIKTVTDGAITLDTPHVVIHVGLPITSDVETLNIDIPESISILDKDKNISQVSMHLEASRGVWAGSSPPTDDTDDPLEELVELKIRNDESTDSPPDLLTQVASMPILSEWNSNGRVFIRQVDPVPLSILSIAPAGKIPIRG